MAKLNGKPLERRDAIYTALEALGHPTRLKILEATAREPTSPTQIADDRATLGTVAYHTRALRDSKLIKLARTGQVRGAVQSFYVISAKGQKLLDSLDLDGKR